VYAPIASAAADPVRVAVTSRTLAPTAADSRWRAIAVSYRIVIGRERRDEMMTLLNAATATVPFAFVAALLLRPSPHDAARCLRRVTTYHEEVR